MGFTPEEVHTKNINKWFDDYDPTVHKAILLDDFDLTHSTLGHYLKIWADKYPFQAEVKGSSKYSIRPEAIIVTSNYKPETVWP